MKTFLFLAIIFLFGSCAKSYFSDRDSSTNKPFDGEKVHLLLTVFEELPNGQNIYRDENKKDFLNLEEIIPSVSKANSWYIKKADKLKAFLKEKNLWEFNFDKFAFCSFASHDPDGSRNLDLYQNIAEKLFNEQGIRNFKTKLKTLTDDNKQDLFAITHTDPDLLDVISFSYGHYRKATGLNLIPDVCPAIKGYLNERFSNNTLEHTTWIEKNKYKLLSGKLSQLHRNSFYGINNKGDKWFFNATKYPLKNSAGDLYNFFETFYYDYFENITSIPKDYFWPIKEMRHNFLRKYLGKFGDYAGYRFFSFLKQLINDRIKFSDGVHRKPLPMKKWLIMGVPNLGKLYLIDFLEKKLGIKFSRNYVGENLSLFFTGEGKDIQYVHLYYNEKYVTKMALSDLLEFSKYEFHDHVEFNKLCNNKEFVDHFENDF